MFKCFRSKKVIPDILNTYRIKCNHDGYIVDIDDNALTLLLYEKQNIQHKFIGILMSPFMNYLHIAILLPKYKKMNTIQKNIAHIFLSALSIKRPLIIYNILQQPIYILLSVNFTKIGFDICFSVKDDIENEHIYLKSINQIKDGRFVPSKNKMIIIAIDFVKSTETLINIGNLQYIDIHTRFHNEIIQIIKKYYYPYIYIHEILGDSYILVLNADWTHNIISYSASLSLSFIIQLIKKTNMYVDIRCGIVYDILHYGYIDHNLRLFGKAIHVATRLEATCEDKYQINCDESFKNKLLEETIYNIKNLEIKEMRQNLKGLGTMQFTTLKVKKNIFEKDYMSSNNIFY